MNLKKLLSVACLMLSYAGSSSCDYAVQEPDQAGTRVVVGPSGNPHFMDHIYFDEHGRLNQEGITRLDQLEAQALHTGDSQKDSSTQMADAAAYKVGVRDDYGTRVVSRRHEAHHYLADHYFDGDGNPTPQALTYMNKIEKKIDGLSKKRLTFAPDINVKEYDPETGEVGQSTAKNLMDQAQVTRNTSRRAAESKPGTPSATDSFGSSDDSAEVSFYRVGTYDDGRQLWRSNRGKSLEVAAQYFDAHGKPTPQGLDYLERQFRAGVSLEKQALMDMQDLLFASHWGTSKLLTQDLAQKLQSIRPEYFTLMLARSKIIPIPIFAVDINELSYADIQGMFQDTAALGCTVADSFVSLFFENMRFENEMALKLYTQWVQDRLFDATQKLFLKGIGEMQRVALQARTISKTLTIKEKNEFESQVVQVGKDLHKNMMMRTFTVASSMLPVVAVQFADHFGLYGPAIKNVSYGASLLLSVHQIKKFFDQMNALKAQKKELEGAIAATDSNLSLLQDLPTISGPRFDTNVRKKIALFRRDMQARLDLLVRTQREQFAAQRLEEEKFEREHKEVEARKVTLKSNTTQELVTVPAQTSRRLVEDRQGFIQQGVAALSKVFGMGAQTLGLWGRR